MINKSKMQTRLLSAILSAAMILAMLPVIVIKAEAADVKISSIEVTQVLGKGIDIDTGKYYFMNMFVAGKPTAIQVVMTDETNIDSAKLDIYYDDKLLTTAKPVDSGERQIFSFVPGKSSVEEWKAGRYKFTVTVGGQTKTTEAIFNNSRTFSILVISASVKYQDKVYDAPDVYANTIPVRTQALPISENKLIAKYRNAKISFGTDDGGYDISTPSGKLGFLADIDKYRSKSATSYDVVVAVVNAPLGESTTGYTDSKHSVVITLDGTPGEDDLADTLLHELGHIFGNGDEYYDGSFKLKVNGAPYGLYGFEGDKQVKGDKPYLKGLSDNLYCGILIHDVQNPYNPKTQQSMLNRSSFMGSSYQHWTTSMVWEAAYKQLIPNDQNVLPRVYTDGSIVPKRPNKNELSDPEIETYKAEYRRMLNEVRASKGLKPYAEDAILGAGDRLLQEASEETLRLRNFGDVIDLNPMMNSLKAETKHYFALTQTSAALNKFKTNEIEDMRSFFTDHPCGKSHIEKDYIFLAFVKADNIVYYMYTCVSGATPQEDDDEKFEPQPQSPPVPTVNPVTNEDVKPDDYVTEVEVTDDDSGRVTDHDGPVPIDEETYTDDDSGRVTDHDGPVPIDEETYTDDDSGRVTDHDGPVPIDEETYTDDDSGRVTTAPVTTTVPRTTTTPTPTTTVPVTTNGNKDKSFGEYSKLTKDQRIQMLRYDSFDMGSPNKDITSDYVRGFFAWYLYDQYGLSVTPDDIQYAIDAIYNSMDYDGMGMRSYSEVAQFSLVCMYYELYPTQELRENASLWDPEEYLAFGENPRRARSDTDEIDPSYYVMPVYDDDDVIDPDGEW